MATDVFGDRLEEQAWELGCAALRYRGLVRVLGPLAFRTRLRRNAALLRAVILEDDEVAARVDRALRRARNEAWPSRSPALRLLLEVRALREQLARRALRRGAAPRRSLREMLEELEAEVVTAPRAIRRGAALGVARELLPRDLPAVVQVARFGALLEGTFKRPLGLDGMPLLSTTDVLALQASWDTGRRAISELWERLVRADPGGSLTRLLRRRAGRAPLRPPVDGPETLCHAEFWLGVAGARLAQVWEDALAPVRPRDRELFPVLEFITRRRAGEAAQLATTSALSGPRAALLELALGLRQQLGSDAPPEPEVWRQLTACARRAEDGAADPDLPRLTTSLRSFIRARLPEDVGAPCALDGTRQSSTELGALLLEASLAAADRAPRQTLIGMTTAR